MNNSNGFKMTEIGLLPEDWEAIKLGDVVSKTKQKDPAKTPDWQFKYIDVSGVNRESLTVEDYNIYFGKEAPSRARKLVETGDVIFATVRPTLKRLALIEEDFNGHICSTAFCVLRANGKKVIPYFLYFVVSREVFINELGKVQRGASYPAVTDTDVKNQNIPLPPLPEQQKIASVLSAVQEAREKTENVLSALMELKKSMMKHLFTYGPVPLEEAERVPLKETEIGMIPEHWEVKRLSDAGVVVMGQSPKGDSYNETGNGVPLINGPAEFGARFPKIVKWTSQPTKMSNVGDILFCVRGNTTGRMNVADSQYCIGRGVAAIRERKGYSDTRYLFYFLTKEAPTILSWAFAGGSTFPNITKSQLENLYVPFPSLPEQEQIAYILSSIDEKIEAEENKKQALEALFKTLLSLLMTGKIRVKDLDI